MKVPFPASNNHNTSKTALSSTRSTTLPAASATTTAASSPYEPKSVLELRSSPSPVSDHKPTSNNTCAADILLADDPLQLDQDHHMLINPQEWDSWMRELGLHDDSSTPVSKQLSSHSDQYHQNQYSNDLLEFPPVISSLDSNHDQFVPVDFGLLPDIPINHNSNPFDALTVDLNNSNWNVVGLDYVDELIRLAECFETNSLQLGQVILARLNQRLRSPIGKPLQRAAFYFKEALQSLLTGSARLAHQPANSSEIIQTIKAQKTFSNISPIPMFSSFTANQALLEAIDGSGHVHIIDFDISFGGHWASFMKELADKADSRKAAPPVIRISALVPEEYAAESKLIRENLSQFARDLNIRFDIDFILIRNFEYLSFKAIKFIDGERVAVILTPAIFRHVGTGFLNDLRRVSPHVVVHVDVEGQMGYGVPSYRQAVIDGLEFYSTLLESMEAANFNVAGGGGDWMRRIETFVLYPKIVEGIQAASRRGTAWREALVAAGFRQVGLSQFADFQAECLLRRVQVRGFHVVKRQAEMLLCWHDRPLVATSAWRF
ncbi:Scarecrow-like protein 15 [Sesamum alatum]|uniref:Scarecrow-like protein 15 n=1 Tax=Sesamum alatum TaxID=300844 RepID=A0AAE2CLR9_9LAMI|nr:Scarecrow-like protein 15 [Sesamum alatum]